MVNPFRNPRIISYCPGVLGLERGLKRAIGAVRTVAYVEIEAVICQNLLAGMQAGLLDAAPVWCNLKTFNAGIFRNKVHIITGGYPCQPFSTAGKRRGTDDPRHLWPFLERDIKAIGPICCFFENVGDHLSLGFDTVYRSLSAMGYAVEAGIFTAEEVGAPHERERLYILAIRKDWLADAKSIKWRLRERKQVPVWQQQGYSTDFEGIGERPMANTQGLRYKITAEKQQEIHNAHEPFQGSWFRGNNTTRWPAYRGQQQYDWEEPRTVITEPAARVIGGWGKKYPESFLPWQVDQVAFNEFTGTVKPEMGCTVDGYNFREDFYVHMETV